MEILKFHRFIKHKAKILVFYTPHAIQQMNLEARMITTDELESVIFKGEIIEDYPEDKRGHSCLIKGYVHNRYIHVVCTPKDDYLAIITAYIPNESQWCDNYSKRRG